MNNKKTMTQKAFLQFVSQFEGVTVCKYDECNCEGVSKLLLAYENGKHFATYNKNNKTAFSTKEF